jgi:LysR family transcriptional regulator, glycine cleavage system transcriptional activator
MRRRLPPLNSLRAFEVVARHTNFRDAASELHVTPAAVSQQIKSLEDHLGRKLLRRHSGGYNLTAEALPGLQDLRAAFERLSAAVHKIVSADQRMLRISTAPSLAAAWLVPRLPLFRERHPTLDVLLHASYEMVDFEHAPFDMAIRYGQGTFPGLASRRLFVDEIIPVCSPKLWNRAESQKPLDLRGVRLIHTHWNPPVGQWPGWAEWLRAAGLSGINAARGPRFSDGALAMQAAAEGQGVALAGRALALDHLAAGRLVQPFEVTIVTDYGFYLVCPKARESEPDLVAFRRWIFAEAKRSVTLPALGHSAP